MVKGLRLLSLYSSRMLCLMILVVITVQARSNINIVIIVKANPGFRKNDKINKALLFWQAGCGVKISYSTDKISVVCLQLLKCNCNLIKAHPCTLKLFQSSLCHLNG